VCRGTRGSLWVCWRSTFWLRSHWHRQEVLEAGHGDAVCWWSVHKQAMIGVKESSGSETSRIVGAEFYSIPRIAEQIAAPVACYVFPADTIFFGNLSIRAFTYPMA